MRRRRMLLFILILISTPLSGHAASGTRDVEVISQNQTSFEDIISERGISLDRIAASDPAYFGTVASLGLLPVDIETAHGLEESLNVTIQDLSTQPYDNLTTRLVSAHTNPDKLVVARRDIPVDSYAAAAYARVTDSPLVQTFPKRTPNQTLQDIELMDPKTIEIIGGDKAITDDVARELGTAMRLQGIDREETALRIAEEMLSIKGLENIDTVVVTDGMDPHPLAVFISVEFEAPLLYTRGDSISNGTKEFLVDNKYVDRFAVYDDDGHLLEPRRQGGIKRYYVIGTSQWTEDKIRELLE